MIADSKWALAIRAATFYFVSIFKVIHCLMTGLFMARITKVGVIEALIEGYIATKTTLVVDIFVTVTFYRTGSLAESKFL